MSWKDAGEFLHHAAQVELFSISSTSVTTMTLLTFVVILLVTAWCSRLIQRAVARAFRLRGIVDEGTIGASTRLAHYIVLFLGLGVGLQTLGLDLTALFAAGAFFAVAMGFAMQNITQNFMSGLILLVERTIKPGDVLFVEGRMVRVVRLGTRATVVRTLDEEDLIVPNGILVQSTVTNYTLRDSLFRLRVLVGVTYGSDMRVVRRTLEEAAAGVPWRAAERDPAVFLKEFGGSSVDWEVSVWTADPWKENTHRSMLHELLWWALQDAGVTIAFPQVDVHVDPPVQDALEALARR